MPLASRINSPVAEPKTKKAKTVASKSKRASGRLSAASMKSMPQDTTTSSTENDDVNNMADAKISPVKNNTEASQPLQNGTNKINRSKSASNGIAAVATETAAVMENDIELKSDLNDTMNDTVMTGNYSEISFSFKVTFDTRKQFEA